MLIETSTASTRSRKVSMSERPPPTNRLDVGPGCLEQLVELCVLIGCVLIVWAMRGFE